MKELDQNEVTREAQKTVSIMLNSKEFTTSLVALIQILREQLPDDFTVLLENGERQCLRVTMRCIQRITKALHSENIDVVRAFDVLIEMYKFF